MNQDQSASTQWKAPAEDGGILLWPDAHRLIAQTRSNHKQLKGSDSVRIQGVPLPELRQQMRRWIGHEENVPLVATGHQIELYHPGVWAKNALINQLAKWVAGSACHFAVDTDAPKHLQLRWPGVSRCITDDPRCMAADWAALLVAPSVTYLESLRMELAQAAKPWAFTPMAEVVLSGMTRLGAESRNLTWVLTGAMHRLDRELGLGHSAVLASPMWLTPAYLMLVYHILARADSFAAVYNAVLDGYRQENRIGHPGRPWPNLRREADGCEAPFWLDRLNERRRERAMLARRGNRWALGGGAAADRLSRFLNDCGARLSPRAMTLMVFLRLLVVDQFVHGIGGGRYDQVTDRVIGRWFGMQPPAFSVTTATLLFPGAAGQARVDLLAMVQEGRRIRHGWSDREKRSLSERIGVLPRNSSQRRELFQAMHERLELNWRSNEYRQWQGRMAQARRQIEREKVTFDRELFYAIQPRERLEWLISKYGRMKVE